MSVTSVNSNSNSAEYYKNTTSSTKIEEPFSIGIQEEPEKEPKKALQKEQEEVPSAYMGLSFTDIFYSGKFKLNQIPVVNQIVSAKNPEDGEIYLTYFTDNKITCLHAGTDGKKAWEVEVNEEQQQKVKDFFKEFTPYKWAKELYSGDDMAMATVKNFWLELFEK